MKTTYRLTLLFGMLTVCGTSQAHKRWLLPSIFSVSEAQWVAVDASVSNNLFYVDRPWPLTSVSVTAPDGKPAKTDNLNEGHRRSSFDVYLDQPGTYRASTGGDVFFVQYSSVDGEVTRDRAFDLSSLKASVPADATAVNYARSVSRLETYMTLGAPDQKVFTPSGRGLELKPVSHPNDLYVNEKVALQFLVEGKPAVGLEVLMVWEGTRYRDEEGAINLLTDDQGTITFTPDRTGRFLLEAGAEKVLTEDPVFSTLYMTYIGTFEVLPQ
ncbi:DUF4198 domain-containing protein [Marinicella sediminis]|uniref:DUF4198 domain-containing protein n=1 Tax=Marinicella sediminis TaxID=1792834 RepID=A0ABV7JG49_9GAMM|nr:DUF4198 domain-containing protein [Marinicella sediminis]